MLKENQFFVKYSKYEFWLRLVTFLVHIISSEGDEVDPRKLEVVKNLSRLLTQMDIRNLSGLAGYY